MRVHVAKSLAIGAVVFATAVTLGAQRQRASPHEKAEATIGAAKISIEYGRPFVKGRKIFGELVPFGKVWRTGADEATTIVTDHAIMFGPVHLSPGTYTLYTIPGEAEWTLIVNKQTGQWGTQYDEKQDLGRVTAKSEKLPAPVEQLTLKLAPGGKGGTLVVEWADTRVSFPFMVH